MYLYEETRVSDHNALPHQFGIAGEDDYAKITFGVSSEISAAVPHHGVQVSYDSPSHEWCS